MSNETIKVLLIDDDEDDYILTRELFSLVKDGEYELDWAASYEEGLQVLARREHHVCLVDYQLGELSGAHLIHQARESRFTTPMILLTGQGDHKIDVEAMEAGATDYLVKDETSPARLERTVRYAVKLNVERCRAEAELERRVAERTAQLQATNKELESFSYSVSHDLRAPLRHMDGFSQALLEDYGSKLDEDGKAYLQGVRNASREMAQLIDDMLQLARVTRTEMQQGIVNLTELGQEVIAELRSRDTVGRDVIVNIDHGLSTFGDKQLLRIVLSNLLGNAWKFTSKREQAKIEFGQSEQGGEQFYFVGDNGAGFEMEYADKLFCAFQRLHTTVEFEGTGIGLATVQRIVSRHGGRVWAKGTVNEEAVFYFTLPNQIDIRPGAPT
ncbi:MAG: ATP-binding protein [Pyrinomonadaceae bacterium]|nr:ATP-binding protein [Pyrinomonadaceae bacterium]